jgi:hypothetical protein
MGTPTIIVPVAAAVTVCDRQASGAARDVKAEGDDASAASADTFRLVDLSPNPPITIYEDARGTGHGSEATHGTVWDCGLILAGYLATREGTDAVRKAVDASPAGSVGVDVGCGAGTAGFALARVAPPCLRVVLTDLDAGLDIAARNVAANPDIAPRCTVRELWWGEGHEADATGGAHAAVVVASDVVYSAESALPLASTLAALCGPNTLCLLGFRSRTTSQTVRAFFDRLTELGLESTSVAREHLGPSYRAGDAHLFVLKRKNP